MPLAEIIPLTIIDQPYNVTELQAQIEYVAALEKGWKFAAHGQRWLYNFMNGSGAAINWSTREQINFEVPSTGEWTEIAVRQVSKYLSKMEEKSRKE